MTKRSLLRLLERERAAATAERAQLIDRICHLSGQPWTLPPRPVDVTAPVEDETPDYLLDLH